MIIELGIILYIIYYCNIYLFKNNKDTIIKKFNYYIIILKNIIKPLEILKFSNAFSFF